MTLTPLLKNPWTLTVVLAVALAAAVALAIHQASELEQKSRTIAEFQRQRDIGGGVMAGSTTVGTQGDVKAAALDAGVPWGAVAQDAKDHGATPNAVTVTVVNSDPQRETGIPSSETIPREPLVPLDYEDEPFCPEMVQCKDSDPWGYQRAAQRLHLEESFSGGTVKVPYGSVTFSAWQQHPWSVDVPERKYRLATVLATDDDGKVTVYTRAVVEVAGKTQVLPIATSDTTEALPEARFRWSTKLYLGADAGVQVPGMEMAVAPSALLSLASYGKVAVQPDWTFFAVGVGYETQTRTPAAVVAPVLWNAGAPLPLIDNLYLGPSVAVDKDGRIAVMGGLHVKM